MKEFGLPMLIVFAIIILCVTMGTAHCTTTKKQGNSLGAVISQDNPLTYKAGWISEGDDVDDGNALVLRMQPIGTYSLFTEDILLCNSPLDMLQGKSNPILLVYETRARRTVQGVGCHKLINALEVNLPKEPQ